MGITLKREGFTDESALEISEDHGWATFTSAESVIRRDSRPLKPRGRGNRVASSGFLAGGFGMLEGMGPYYRNG